MLLFVFNIIVFYFNEIVDIRIFKDWLGDSVLLDDGRGWGYY